MSWICPSCSREFASANLWHSCGNYSLDAHFFGKDAGVRATFDALIAAIERIGPVTVYAQKTRIVIQRRVRFASVNTRKHHLLLGVWLDHPVEHPVLQRNESIGKHWYVWFRLSAASEIDDALIHWLAEGYQR